MSPKSTDAPAPVLEHLQELRRRILKMAIGVLAGSVVGIVFAGDIKGILERPYLDACVDCTFLQIEPGELFAVWMRIAVFAGLVVGSPVVLWQIWSFVNPALTRTERKWAVPMIGACTALFVAGIGFGYLTLPKALEFLTSIFEVETKLTLGAYVGFTIRYLLAFGLSFLYPVFLFASAAMGMVSSRQLASGRRWAFLGIVVAAAVITPSGDALTLMLLSAPLYLFYEITYWLVRLVLRK